MGKIRYYCEYCDRSFLDDMKARKKHLSGTQHARMRKLYYMPFRSAKEIYEEERLKDPCRRFIMQNNCPFGENCRFSHYSPYELDRIRLQAEEEESSSSPSSSVNPQSETEALQNMPSSEKLANWLSSWKTKQEKEDLKPAKPAVQAISRAWSSDLPAILKGYNELPPSLQPWNMFNLLNVPVEDWG